MNIIVALLIFGLIVTIHELGHFLLAKKNGITVIEFSIGMGPRLLTTVKRGTRYSLKLFPIGGSCQMGEDDPEDKKRYLIYLTEKGKIAYDAHEEYHDKYDKALFDFLDNTSSDKLESIKGFLEHAISLIQIHS